MNEIWPEGEASLERHGTGEPTARPYDFDRGDWDTRFGRTVSRFSQERIKFAQGIDALTLVMIVGIHQGQR